jgi:hypothetical protein
MLLPKTKGHPDWQLYGTMTHVVAGYIRQIGRVEAHSVSVYNSEV